MQELILGEDCGEDSLRLPATQTTWTNFAFVAVGVLAGLAVGQIAQSHTAQRRALLGLTLLSAISLSALSALCSHPVFTALGPSTTYALLILCMAATGVGLLGFISVALRMAVTLGEPASEVYSAGGLELVLQVCSALFAQTLGCQAQFIPCAATVWVCFFLLSAVHGRPKRHALQPGMPMPPPADTAALGD